MVLFFAYSICIVIITVISILTYAFCQYVNKYKSRIIVISLDGNIGAGKSTLLKKLDRYIKSFPKYSNEISIINEPVHIWEQTGILKEFYNDKKKYAGGFQYFVLNTLIHELQLEMNKYKESKIHIIITERSLESTRWVFAKMLYDDGFINNVEMNMYLYLYNLIDQKYLPSATIYLNTLYDTCNDRIEKRNRDGESNISIEYLQKCENYYYNMIINNEKPTFHIIGDSYNENDIRITNQICEQIIRFIYSI
jgi:deoxyadenosine/deoxycytidine kinase